MDHQASAASQGSDESPFVGYMRLAELMSDKPDAAVFRRFRLLQMMHLLQLQAELQDLEDSLRGAWEEDRAADGHRPRFCLDFSAMRLYCEEDSEQLETLEKIGKKLEEYYGALRNALPLEKAAIPSKQNLEFLRLWLARENCGEGFLEGIEGDTWNQKNDSEYISLKSAPTEATEDWLAKLLNGKVLEVYNKRIGRYSKDKTKNIDGKIRYYDPEKIKQVGDGIVVALSAVLPTLAILVLYFVENMIQRMGLVILFTAVFAIAMALLTGAKRIEIFSATAAFAAVEVVSYQKRGQTHIDIGSCGSLYTILPSGKLVEHARAPDPCSIKVSDPRDGFGEDIERSLRSRKRTRAADNRETKWAEVFRLLFPTVDTIPSPYHEHDHQALTQLPQEQVSAYKDRVCAELESPLLRQKVKDQIAEELSIFEDSIKERAVDVFHNLFKGIATDVLRAQQLGGKGSDTAHQAVSPRESFDGGHSPAADLTESVFQFDSDSLGLFDDFDFGNLEIPITFTVRRLGQTDQIEQSDGQALTTGGNAAINHKRKRAGDQANVHSSDGSVQDSDLAAWLHGNGM